MLLLPPFTLAVSGWVISLLAVGFVLVCLFMMLVILVQKPKGGGLSGAFGGAGGGSAQAAFGAKVGDVLTWLTVACFVLFILLGMGLTWTINPTVAEHQADAAQPPATQTIGGEAEDAAEDNGDPEGDVPAVGDLDATLDAVQQATGQTEPDPPQSPAEHDDDAAMTDRPDEADATEPTDNGEAGDTPETDETPENADTAEAVETTETPAADDAPAEP